MAVLRGLGWLEGRFIAPDADQRNGVPEGEWQRRAEGRRAADQGEGSRFESPPGDRDQ